MNSRGLIPDRVIQSCKDFLNYTRCERPDGTIYGTSGRCIKGTEAERADEDKVARVSRALNSDFDTFLSEFGGSRQRIIEDSANATAERIASTPLSKLEKTDIQRLISAKRLAVLISEVQELRKLGEEGKAAIQVISSTKEMFDDMKWHLVNERIMVSEGTLREAWKGTPLIGKAKDVFKDPAFGQSKVIVGEHPVPTKVLKRDLLNKSSAVPNEIVRSTLRRNIISMTSAPEDLLLSRSGYVSSMPNEKETWSRYNAVGIKVFPLISSITHQPGADIAHRRFLEDSAKEARESGKTFEEWAATVIDI